MRHALGECLMCKQDDEFKLALEADRAKVNI